MILFDIETNGLLDTVSLIHVIRALDTESGQRFRFCATTYADGSPTLADGGVADGLDFLHGKYLCGHNIITYDIPVMQKLRPGFRPGRVLDTLVCARVIWPAVKDNDFTAIRAGRLPAEFTKQGLLGKHSLAAWGYRLGDYKGDFDPKSTGHTWATVPFSRDMDDYCAQDVEVTRKLAEKIVGKNYSPPCLDLEHRVAEIIQRQTAHGFGFDEPAATKLYIELQGRKAAMEAELGGLFPPWEVRTPFTPKASNKKLGYVKGQMTYKVKKFTFNPSSRDHIADRLMKVRGWVPQEFTENGKPKVDETTLASLPWPEAKKLTDYLTVDKRLGQLADGSQGWLKAVRNGRIHGSVNPNGAVTGRMTHSHPNIGQVPRVGSPYGAECRALFRATPGLKLVGCDAEGLELRMLAHYMARWDGGAYAETVVNGRKEDGTDVHNVTKSAVGLNSRDNAKTFIYAMLYGAGPAKLGSIILDDMPEDRRARFHAKNRTKPAHGKALRQLGLDAHRRIVESLPAFGRLVDAVKSSAQRGYLIGLDGRHLSVRSQHAALNTLLQSAGAVVMKRALVLFDEAIAESPALRDSVWFCANVHDEFQVECHAEIAEQVGRLAADSIRLAGESFTLRCPLSGSYSVGETWADTH